MLKHSNYTWCLHRSSLFGLPPRILNLRWVKPKHGTRMETVGRFVGVGAVVEAAL